MKHHKPTTVTFSDADTAFSGRSLLNTHPGTGCSHESSSKLLLEALPFSFT